MTTFELHRATTLADAIAQLRDPARMPVGGGTDLLETIAEGLAAPTALVDIRAVPEALGIVTTASGAVRIGAAVRLEEIATHPLMRERYPSLASACEQVGTPAIRATATLGGNLCQRPRCPYFRRNVPCHKNGGSSCPAVRGENRYLAIVEGGPCWIVHPSDAAVVLVALDAVIEIAGERGHREVAAAELFVLPRDRMDRETVLIGNELIVGIRLPTDSAGGVQRYTRSMQRDTSDFAFVSLAAMRREDGEVRLVLGGVSPRPYRVYTSVEEEVTSGGLDEDTIAGLAERALLDAEPLSENGDTLELASSLLRDAIRMLATE